jgi:hypothetical protein
MNDTIPSMETSVRAFQSRVDFDNVSVSIYNRGFDENGKRIREYPIITWKRELRNLAVPSTLQEDTKIEITKADAKLLMESLNSLGIELEEKRNSHVIHLEQVNAILERELAFYKQLLISKYNPIFKTKVKDGTLN